MGLEGAGLAHCTLCTVVITAGLEGGPAGGTGGGLEGETPKFLLFGIEAVLFSFPQCAAAGS